MWKVTCQTILMKVNTRGKEGGKERGEWGEREREKDYGCRDQNKIQWPSNKEWPIKHFFKSKVLVFFHWEDILTK